MKAVFCLLVFWISLSFCNAQWHSLQVTVDGYEGNRVYLIQIVGDQQSLIDSASSLNGSFSFHFPEKAKVGVYRIVLGESRNSNFFDEDPKYFDFIYNTGNISLATSYNSPVESMKVLESKENDIYYRFLKAEEIYQAKLNRITPLFELYDSEDLFYSPLKQEFAEVQSAFARLCVALIAESPASLASSIIQISMLPGIENDETPEQMRLFVRDHYFDLKPFSDVRLLNTPYLAKTILDYLGLYRSPEFTQQQQEESFILAIDKIMEAVSGEPAIYDFTLNYLVDGFQRFQMEDVLVHIAENFIEGGCETDSKALLQKRLEGYARMAPGKKVPDILLLDQNDKQVRLYDLENEYSLVIFWASWCPHCTSFMKQLAKWYPERTVDIEVYAVSIDSSRFAWEWQIMNGNYPWINTLSLGGWEGKAPKDFNVYATPTLFLLDREHKIVSKPLTFKEFKKAIGGE